MEMNSWPGTHPLLRPFSLNLCFHISMEMNSRPGTNPLLRPFSLNLCFHISMCTMTTPLLRSEPFSSFCVCVCVCVFFFVLTIVLSYWDFFHGRFRMLSPGKASPAVTVVLPNLKCLLGIYIFHNPQNSDLWDARRCLCMRLHIRIYRHRKRVCAENWLGEKSRAALGNWTCISSVPVQHYQLSYIPIM